MVLLLFMGVFIDPSHPLMVTVRRPGVQLLRTLFEIAVWSDVLNFADYRGLVLSNSDAGGRIASWFVLWMK